MKKISMLILVCASISNLIFAANKPYKSKDIIKSDTINATVIETHAEKVIVSTKDVSVKNLMDTIKLYPASSYVLIVKLDKNKWVVNKHPDATALSDYHPKRITVLEGAISIMGVKYDTDHVVIVE